MPSAKKSAKAAPKIERAIYLEFAQGLAEAAQHVTQAREIAGGAFCQSQATRVATGPRADFVRFEYNYSFLRSQMTQPGRGCQAGESSADDGKINFRGKRVRSWLKIDRPGRLSPAPLE